MLIVICLLCSAVIGSTHAEEGIGINEKQYADFTGVDSVLLDFLTKNHYTGATIGISKGNRLVYTQGYGWTADDTKMKPTTMLPISSMSKSITAIAILKLYADGQLNISDRVFGPSGILHDLTAYNSVIADRRALGITVEHLLQHTSGWSQTNPLIYDPMMNTVYLARGHNVTNIAFEMGINGILNPRDIISYMLSVNLDTNPGMKFQYSNLGYCILGRVIEEVSGMPYKEFIKEEMLTPLGMIHTRLGPHSGYSGGPLLPRLQFADGDVDVFHNSSSVGNLYELWDSTLGWFSTVYDISRFANGLTDRLIVNHTVLSLLTSQPKGLVSTKKERWYGYGVYTDRHHAWWQVGDPHHAEMLLLHMKCKKIKQTQTGGKHPCSDREDFNILMIMSMNNRKDIKQLAENLLASVNTWPEYDQSFRDLGIETGSTNDDNNIILLSYIPESKILPLTNVFIWKQYYPYWMDAYVVNHVTYFSVIFKHDTNNKHRVALSATKQDFNLLVQRNYHNGYHLTFVVSCNSASDSGRIRHSGIFSTDRQKDEATWWNQAWAKYVRGTLKYYTAEKYTPVIQSVTVHKLTKHVTYRFEKLRDSKNWQTFTDITRNNLEQVIKDNALQERRLRYLDSYQENGELYFSGIFTSDSNQWIVQIDLTSKELQEHMFSMSKLNFDLEIVVGYEVAEEAMFVAAWTR